ncbi:uncharacterized protein LOC135834524 [Planococcus citri]|uniref:uncharacterized protein LOC135834524 n=1 Tax=Planococcus citri TaxID=170843 RepID=UPI0031F9C94D
MAANKLFHTQLWVTVVSYYLIQCTWTQHATAAVLISFPGNQYTLYTQEQWISVIENCGNKLARVLHGLNPDFKEFALSFEQMINVYFNRTGSWPHEALFRGLFMTVITQNWSELGINGMELYDLPRMYEELANTTIPDFIIHHRNKAATIFQLRYCEGNKPNMSMIEDMLKNGTTEALKYADWYLHGRYQDEYDTPRVNVVVLVVTEYENEKRVVLQTCHKLKVTTANYWPNSFTRPT